MRRTTTAGLLAAATLGIAAPGLAPAEPAAAAHSTSPVTMAVIGDAPYGDASFEKFPRLVAQINRDPAVSNVVHVGDIKTGSSLCTTSYFRSIYAYFELFRDPLVYTPGDNEWTDCHREDDGGYVPTERLAEVRRIFFAHPGSVLGGGHKSVNAQNGYPENQRWLSSSVVFSTFNVQGSNNDLVPWFDAAEPGARQLAEFAARNAANSEWLRQAFSIARRHNAAGVVLFLQADMWDPSAAPEDLTGFARFKSELERRAAGFGKPVLLVNGDSHEYDVRTPLAGAPNLTQVTIEQSQLELPDGDVATEWLRLHVRPDTASVFSWERVRSTVG